ncbi:hypothetical protein BDM02DRAFT_3094347 [Thelephora ganbajun]|uniref:Uncharacterized protein n=1 Tax=Thelephora ganbajun TaxID=370292 RepID=A0ACB6ZKG4_THEGA|nr:hypothetical protein BDM02DRAFT_3094347 [Thelephora ganbajun]
MFHLWDSEIPQAVKDTGIPVSIMLWSTDQYKIDRFLQFAQPGYASHAAGYNEVNQVGQGQTSPDRAVQVWYQCLRPLVEKGYTLMGPVTTSAPDGYDWMVQFFNQCGGDCHVDEVPIHWYDVRFEDFQVYINKWAGFGKPLRVTEFACQNFNGGNQPSMDQIWQFTGQAINYLESDNRILSYAPFGFMDDMYNVTPDDRLFAFQSYGLSDLGWNYVKGH